MKYPQSALILIAALYGAVLQSKPYEFIDLGRPNLDPSREWYITNAKINNRGTIAFLAIAPSTFTIPTTITRGFVYREGSYFEIPNPRGWRITVEDLNDLDEIVGGLHPWDYTPESYFFDGYVFNAATDDYRLASDLFGGTEIVPIRINNSGQILLAVDADEIGGIYDNGTSSVHIPFGQNSELFWPSDLNNSGQILFASLAGDPVDGSPAYFVYTIGDNTPIALPRYFPSAPSLILYTHLSDTGTAIGTDASGNLAVTRNETVTIVNTPGYFSIGEINDRDFVVGHWYSEAQNTANVVLYDGQSLHSLESLIAKGKLRDWRLGSATGLNDLGQIVGSMVNKLGQHHLFLLDPHQPAKRSW